jgi:hypothetical protein
MNFRQKTGIYENKIIQNEIVSNHESNKKKFQVIDQSHFCI